MVDGLSRAAVELVVKQGDLFARTSPLIQYRLFILDKYGATWKGAYETYGIALRAFREYRRERMGAVWFEIERMEF